jgi:hypothetical protein
MNDDKDRRTDLKIPDPPRAVRALLESFTSKPGAETEPATKSAARLPGFSATGNVTILLACGFLLPLVFMLLKSLNVTLASERVAATLIGVVSALWPVAALNYEAIKSFASEQIAINYAVFLSTILIFFVAVTIVAIREFVISKNDSTSLADAATLAVFTSLLTWGMHYMNAVKPAREARYDFYIDNAGVYYFKQFFYIACGNLTVVLLVYIFVRVFLSYRSGE